MDAGEVLRGGCDQGDPGHRRECRHPDRDADVESGRGHRGEESEFPRATGWIVMLTFQQICRWSLRHSAVHSGVGTCRKIQKQMWSM